MKKEPTFFKALPATEREKLREKQKLHTYREYTRNLTALDVNKQMDAESEYLIKENEFLFRRLTDDDTAFLDITPENFRVLGELAKRLPERYRRDITIMSFEDLMRGYEHFRKNPPKVKSNQIPLEIQQQIIDIALENPTWGSPHILHALRNIGNFQLQEYHVRQVLRKNHIPVVAERIKKGLPWRTFVQGLKSVNGGGVIFK